MSQALNNFQRSTRPVGGDFSNDLADFDSKTFGESAGMESSFTAGFLGSDAVLPSLNETANTLSNSLFTPAENSLPLMSSLDVPNNIPAIEISNSLNNKWGNAVGSFNALPKTQDEHQAINTAQSIVGVINNKSLLENPFSGKTSGELISLVAKTPPNALGFLSKELASNGAELGQNHLDFTFQFLEGKDFTTAVDLFHQADIKQSLNLKNPFNKGMNIGLHALGSTIAEPEKFIDGIVDTTKTAGTLLGHSLLGTNRLTKHTEAAADSREYVSNFTSKVINGSIEGSEKYLNLGIPETLAGQLVFGGMTAATGGIAIEAGAITAAGKIVNAANKILPTDGLNGTSLAQSIGRALPALEEKYLNGNILLPSFSHRFNAVSDGFNFKKVADRTDWYKEPKGDGRKLNFKMEKGEDKRTGVLTYLITSEERLKPLPKSEISLKKQARQAEAEKYEISTNPDITQRLVANYNPDTQTLNISQIGVKDTGRGVPDAMYNEIIQDIKPQNVSAIISEYEESNKSALLRQWKEGGILIEALQTVPDIKTRERLGFSNHELEVELYNPDHEFDLKATNRNHEFGYLRLDINHKTYDSKNTLNEDELLITVLSKPTI